MMHLLLGCHFFQWRAVSFRELLYIQLFPLNEGHNPMPDEPSGTPGKLPYRITSRGEAWLRTVILWEDLETAPIRSPNSWHRLVGLILAKARGGSEGMAGWGDVNLDSWKVIYPPGNYHIPPGEVGNIIDSNMPNIRGIC